MSHYRWTMKELKEISNKELTIRILNERQADCTNPYSPLYARLDDLKKWVSGIEHDTLKTYDLGYLDERKQFKTFVTQVHISHAMGFVEFIIHSDGFGFEGWLVFDPELENVAEWRACGYKDEGKQALVKAMKEKVLPIVKQERGW